MSEAASAQALTASIEAERVRVAELRKLVQQEQKKADRLQSTQATLETNMSRLYEAAKAKVDDVTQALTAARREDLQRGAPAPTQEMPSRSKRPLE